MAQLTFRSEAQDHFPHLHLLLLKGHAETWVNSFSEIPIKSIILRPASFNPNRTHLVIKSLEKEGITARQNRLAKYEIVFVLPEKNPIYKGSILGVSGEEVLGFSLALVRGSKPFPFETANTKNLYSVSLIPGRNTWRDDLAATLSPQYHSIFISSEESGAYDDSFKGFCDFEDCPLTVKVSPGPMQRFLDVIEYERSSFDESLCFEILMPEGLFESVYKIQPIPGNWREDWRVSLSRDPDIISTLNGPYYVLFPSANKAIKEGKRLEDGSRKVIENSDAIEKKPPSLLPCDPGANWEDISITFTSNDQVRIKTPQGEERYNYAQIGMASKKNTETKTRDWVLLRLFAENYGAMNSEDIDKYKNIFQGAGKDPYKTFMNQTKLLNKFLKNLFGINHSIYIGHYKKMWRDELNLKKFFPDLFEPIKPINGVEDLKRMQSIWELLKKKGYATKFKIISKLEKQYNSTLKKSLFDSEIEEAKRKEKNHNSRKNTSYNPS